MLIAMRACVSASSDRHPLAATVVLRTMMAWVLARSRDSRYGHAARHLAECASLLAAVGDWGGVGFTVTVHLIDLIHRTAAACCGRTTARTS